MSWLDGIRWRVAMWLAPSIDTALGKRRLEQVARECGASKTVSTKIAGAFFRSLRDGR